jgi:hypothetical protein
MFRNREDAGRQLAERLKQRTLSNPLVLGIPRGGVVIGAVLARELGAELDVVLARKLRAPGQPELAIGAIAEDGQMHLNRLGQELTGDMPEYVDEEHTLQQAEIKRRQRLFRKVRPQAAIQGRSVIVTDDGIATGATMLAALQVLRSQGPLEIIVAVPVGSPDRLVEVEPYCDELVCLLCPDDFWAIGQFYRDFQQVDDESVIELLRRHAPDPVGNESRS